MKNTLPWRYHRASREGLIQAFEAPGIPLHRKLGALAITGASLVGLSLQADVLYSDYVTPDVAPKIVLAAGSISCRDAKAMVLVFSGYGIQNGEITAARITPIANERNMCTEWVDNGTNIQIHAVGERTAEVARANDVDQIIPVGESVGGVEAALVANDMISEYGDEFTFPGILLDSTPAGKDTLKWVNRTIAEKVSENCQYLKLGDVTMTAISLLTDQNEYRRTHPWEYWSQVYNATRTSSMKLRTGQSCMAGQDFPQINKDANIHISYARTALAYRDPIIDVALAEAKIREKSNGLFEPIYMQGDGITHASPWDNWTSYEPYYDSVLSKIDGIIVTRALDTWYKKAPHIPQPR